MLKNNNDEATNDFDFEPEKIAPKSTIRRQINTVKRLIEQKHVLTTSRILPTFDRLKIYIDLEKYGKKIGFKIGKNLKRSDFPELSPYEQKVRLNNISRVTFHADDTDQADDYDSETADNTNSTSHKYDNYSISYDIFINTLDIDKSTYEELHNIFMHQARMSYSLGTIKNYDGLFKNHFSTLKERKISDITPLFLDYWLKEKELNGKSVYLINDCIKLVSAVFHYCENKRVIPIGFLDL